MAWSAILASTDPGTKTEIRLTRVEQPFLFLDKFVSRGNKLIPLIFLKNAKTRSLV